VPFQERLAGEAPVLRDYMKLATRLSTGHVEDYGVLYRCEYYLPELHFVKGLLSVKNVCVVNYFPSKN
jgi:hypothetical protein